MLHAFRESLGEIELLACALVPVLHDAHALPYDAGQEEPGQPAGWNKESILDS